LLASDFLGYTFLSPYAYKLIAYAGVKVSKNYLLGWYHKG